MRHKRIQPIFHLQLQTKCNCVNNVMLCDLAAQLLLSTHRHRRLQDDNDLAPSLTVHCINNVIWQRSFCYRPPATADCRTITILLSHSAAIDAIFLAFAMQKAKSHNKVRYLFDFFHSTFWWLFCLALIKLHCASFSLVAVVLVVLCILHFVTASRTAGALPKFSYL